MLSDPDRELSCSVSKLVLTLEKNSNPEMAVEAEEVVVAVEVPETKLLETQTKATEEAAAKLSPTTIMTSLLCERFSRTSDITSSKVFGVYPRHHTMK
jgi:hypothetical protein